MAWPLPVPLDARNCILYGFIRDAGGNAASRVQVLIGAPYARADAGITTETGQTFGEDQLDYDLEVFTDATGYWQAELRRGMFVRVTIPRLKIATEAMIPEVVRQDFTYWAYQPVISDTRKFIPDPYGAPLVVDTSLLVRVDADLSPFLLKLFDQIKIWASPTRGGVYVEVTTALTRPELVDNKVFYEHYMAGVAAGQWYRASYFNSTRVIDGPLGPPRKNDPEDYTSVLTVDELKEYYLFGVSLVDDTGKPYSHDMFVGYIKDAIGWFEREIDISLKPVSVAESQDFNVADYDSWCFLQLEHKPVIAIDKMEFVLGNSSVFTVPSAWIHFRPESGQVQLVPTSGSLGTAMLTTPGNFGSLLIRMFSRVPDYLRVTYRHGFSVVPPEFKNLIAYRASFGPLNIAGDMLGGAGIASASMSQDGISQSYSTTSCFVAGTPIRTADGVVPIERIEAGNQVIAGHPAQLDPFTVLRAGLTRLTNELVEVAVAGSGKFRCTPEHLWRCSAGYWPAEALYPGMQLGSDDPDAHVESVTPIKLAEPVPVYDLEVPEVHNFGLADGNRTILVHNSATNAGYGARLIQYTKEIKERMPGIRRFYHGIRSVIA